MNISSSRCDRFEHSIHSDIHIKSKIREKSVMSNTMKRKLNVVFQVESENSLKR